MSTDKQEFELGGALTKKGEPPASTLTLYYNHASLCSVSKEIVTKGREGNKEAELCFCRLVASTGVAA